MAERLSDFLMQLPPGRLAIDYGEQAISVGELQDDSARLAAGLRALGITAGDRVALWLPNIPAWLSFFFACARIGAIAVSVNTRFRAQEVEDIVGRAGCRALVLWPGFKAIDFRGILAEVTPGALAALTDIVTYSEEPTPTPFALGNCRVTPHTALLASASDALAPAPADARCVIFTTSGTTKAPKFVCHQQWGVAQHAREVAVGFGFDAPGSRVMQALPLCGVFGFTQALAALAAGAPMRMVPANEQEVVTWRGRFRPALQEQAIYPRPMQAKLPIWLGVGGTPASFVRAGSLGLPLMVAVIGGETHRFRPLIDLYREAGDKAGFAQEDLKVGLHSLGYVAQTHEEAVENYYPGYAETFTRIGRERGWPPVTRGHFEAQNSKWGAYLVGDSDEVAEKILRHSESWGGIDRFTFQLDNAGLSHQQLSETIALIGEEVIPKVKKRLSHV